MGFGKYGLRSKRLKESCVWEDGREEGRNMLRSAVGLAVGSNIEPKYASLEGKKEVG